MNHLPMIDMLGFWLGIFLTFCILSFLYKDNPFYKFAEHLFIGVSIGYVITQQYYNVLRPKLVDRLAHADHWFWTWDIFALILVLLMFVKVMSSRLGWLGRYPLAFVVALYAGLQINGVAQADLGQQIQRATQNMDLHKVNINKVCKQNDDDERDACIERQEKALATVPGITAPMATKIRERAEKKQFDSLDEIASMNTISAAERVTYTAARGSVIGTDAKAATSTGQRDWFGIFSQILLFIGLLASLVYFYFSVEHKGTIGKISRFGVWVLMIGFGASFGLTVQGRIALAIGRVQDVAGTNMNKTQADQIHGPYVALASVVIIIAGLVIWELRDKRKRQAGPPSSGGGEK